MRTTISIELHTEVISSLKKYHLLANCFFDKRFALPKISYRQKGAIAGSAFLERWEIQLNTSMLLDNSIGFIDEVIPHELAHLIAFKQFGRVKPHGKEWQSIMAKVFQCKPNRTHHFQLPDSIKQRRYNYRCECQQHWLSAIRHKKIQSKKTQYSCLKCGQILTLQQ